MSTYEAVLQHTTATTLVDQGDWTPEKLTAFLYDPNEPTNSHAKQLIGQVCTFIAQQEQLKQQLFELQLTLDRRAGLEAIAEWEAKLYRTGQRSVTELADQQYIELRYKTDQEGLSGSPLFEEINKLHQRINELVRQQNALLKEINTVSQKMAKNIATMLTTERDWGTGMNYALNVAKAFVDTHVTFPKDLKGEQLEQAKNDLALGMLSEVGDYLDSKNPNEKTKEAILTKGLQAQLNGQGCSLKSGVPAADLLKSCPPGGGQTLQETMQKVNTNEQEFQQAKTDQKTCTQQRRALEEKFDANSKAIATTKQEVQAKEKQQAPIVTPSPQPTASASNTPHLAASR